MKTPASVKGHPLHPMLIALPIGLWVFSVICDVVSRAGGGPSWDTSALFSLGGGIVGGVVAAIPGLVDWLSITDSAIKRLGVFHMLANVSGLLLFTLSFYLRWSHAGSDRAAFVCSVAGLLVLSVGGWLGGSLVYKHRVAVSEN